MYANIDNQVIKTMNIEMFRERNVSSSTIVGIPGHVSSSRRLTNHYVVRERPLTAPFDSWRRIIDSNGQLTYTLDSRYNDLHNHLWKLHNQVDQLVECCSFGTLHYYPLYHSGIALMTDGIDWQQLIVIIEDEEDGSVRIVNYIDSINLPNLRIPTVAQVYSALDKLSDTALHSLLRGSIECGLPSLYSSY